MGYEVGLVYVEDLEELLGFGALSFGGGPAGGECRAEGEELREHREHGVGVCLDDDAGRRSVRFVEVQCSVVDRDSQGLSIDAQLVAKGAAAGLVGVEHAPQPE